MLNLKIKGPLTLIQSMSLRIIQPRLIGERKTLLHQSKIKVDVVLVGLLLQLKQLKVQHSLLMVNWINLLLNNLSIVLLIQMNVEVLEVVKVQQPKLLMIILKNQLDLF